MHACGDSRTGAALLAAELGCASADMLHEANEDDVAALARAGVAAVVCPGYRPAAQRPAAGPLAARQGRHRRARPRITPRAATASPRWRWSISLAVSYLGMSVDEALRAATIGGAHALRAPDRGAMVRGRLADMVLWDADHEGAFVWSFGLAPRRVWLGGEPVTA